MMMRIVFLDDERYHWLIMEKSIVDVDDDDDDDADDDDDDADDDDGFIVYDLKMIL